MTPQGPQGRQWSTEEHFASPRSNGFRVMPVYTALLLVSVLISHSVCPICTISCELKCSGVEHDRICMALRPAVYEFVVFVHPAEGVCAGNPSKATLWVPWINVVFHGMNITKIHFVRFVHAFWWILLKASRPTSKPRWKQTVGRKNWLSIMDMLAFDLRSPKVSVWIGFLAKRCPCAWFSKWPDLGRTERCRIYSTFPLFSCTGSLRYWLKRLLAYWWL